MPIITGPVQRTLMLHCKPTITLFGVLEKGHLRHQHAATTRLKVTSNAMMATPPTVMDVRVPV